MDNRLYHGCDDLPYHFKYCAGCLRQHHNTTHEEDTCPNHELRCYHQEFSDARAAAVARINKGWPIDRFPIDLSIEAPISNSKIAPNVDRGRWKQALWQSRLLYKSANPHEQVLFGEPESTWFMDDFTVQQQGLGPNSKAIRKHRNRTPRRHSRVIFPEDRPPGSKRPIYPGRRRQTPNRRSISRDSSSNRSRSFDDRSTISAASWNPRQQFRPEIPLPKPIPPHRGLTVDAWLNHPEARAQSNSSSRRNYRPEPHFSKSNAPRFEPAADAWHEYDQAVVNQSWHPDPIRSRQIRIDRRFIPKTNCPLLYGIAPDLAKFQLPPNLSLPDTSRPPPPLPRELRNPIGHPIRPTPIRIPSNQTDFKRPAPVHQSRDRVRPSQNPRNFDHPLTPKPRASNRDCSPYSPSAFHLAVAKEKALKAFRLNNPEIVQIQNPTATEHSEPYMARPTVFYDQLPVGENTIAANSVELPPAPPALYANMIEPSIELVHSDNSGSVPTSVEQPLPPLDVQFQQFEQAYQCACSNVSDYSPPVRESQRNNTQLVSTENNAEFPEQDPSTEKGTFQVLDSCDSDLESPPTPGLLENPSLLANLPVANSPIECGNLIIDLDTVQSSEQIDDRYEKYAVELASLRAINKICETVQATHSVTELRLSEARATLASLDRPVAAVQGQSMTPTR